MKKFILFVIFSVYGFAESLSPKFLEDFINTDMARIAESANSERDVKLSFEPAKCENTNVTGNIKCVVKQAVFSSLKHDEESDEPQLQPSIFLNNIVINFDTKDLKNVTYNLTLKQITYNVNLMDEHSRKNFSLMKLILPKSLEMSGTMKYNKPNNALIDSKIALISDKYTLNVTYKANMESIFLGSNFADTLRLYHTQLKVLDMIDTMSDDDSKIKILKDLVDGGLDNFTFGISGDILGALDIIDKLDSNGNDEYSEYKISTKEKWLSNVQGAKQMLEMPKESYPGELDDIKNDESFNKVLNLAKNAVNAADNVLSGKKKNITFVMSSAKSPAPYLLKTLVPWAEEIDKLNDDSMADFIKDSIKSFFSQYNVDVRN